jgi:hypothetical protein
MNWKLLGAGIGLLLLLLIFYLFFWRTSLPNANINANTRVNTAGNNANANTNTANKGENKSEANTPLQLVDRQKVMELMTAAKKKVENDFRSICQAGKGTGQCDDNKTLSDMFQQSEAACKINPQQDLCVQIKDYKAIWESLGEIEKGIPAPQPRKDETPIIVHPEPSPTLWDKFVSFLFYAFLLTGASGLLLLSIICFRKLGNIDGRLSEKIDGLEKKITDNNSGTETTVKTLEKSSTVVERDSSDTEILSEITTLKESYNGLLTEFSTFKNKITPFIDRAMPHLMRLGSPSGRQNAAPQPPPPESPHITATLPATPVALEDFQRGRNPNSWKTVKFDPLNHRLVETTDKTGLSLVRCTDKIWLIIPDFEGLPAEAFFMQKYAKYYDKVDSTSNNKEIINFALAEKDGERQWKIKGKGLFAL